MSDPIVNPDRLRKYVVDSLGNLIQVATHQSLKPGQRYATREDLAKAAAPAPAEKAPKK